MDGQTCRVSAALCPSATSDAEGVLLRSKLTLNKTFVLSFQVVGLCALVNANILSPWNLKYAQS